MEQEVEQRAIRKDWKEKEEPKEFGETDTPTTGESSQRAGLATGALNRHGAPPQH
jgi:hypothetical protein